MTIPACHARRRATRRPSIPLLYLDKEHIFSSLVKGDVYDRVEG